MLDLITLSTHLTSVRDHIRSRLIGQDRLVDDLLLGIFSGGHILIEWVPGLGKTLAIQTIAEVLGLPFHRISFTPDLLPADLIGGEVYRAAKGDFIIRKWPLFTSILLADEINRTPPKVQSALLEAMEERKVTIADTTFDLPSPFLVFATMNPLEQSGTYPLPEAQLDRFVMKLVIGYPAARDEIEILRQQSSSALRSRPIEPLTDLPPVTEIQSAITSLVRVDDRLYHYVSEILEATRYPRGIYAPLAPLIEYGASTRAGLAMIRLARVRAVQMSRDYVLPDDIKSVAHGVLRHRIGLSYEAIGSRRRSDEIIAFILDHTIVP